MEVIGHSAAFREVLDLAAFVLIFTAITRNVTANLRGAESRL